MSTASLSVAFGLAGFLIDYGVREAFAFGAPFLILAGWLTVGVAVALIVVLAGSGRDSLRTALWSVPLGCAGGILLLRLAFRCC